LRLPPLSSSRLLLILYSEQIINSILFTIRRQKKSSTSGYAAIATVYYDGMDLTGPLDTDSNGRTVSGPNCTARIYKGTGKGMTYEGGLLRNKRHGKGILTWPNGQRYEGDFVNDVKHGYGVMRMVDGNTNKFAGTYEGEFRNDVFNGKCVITEPSGARYEGQCKDGKRHGKGLRTSEDGVKFEGEWYEDSMARAVCTTVHGTQGLVVLDDQGNVSEPNLGTRTAISRIIEIISQFTS
jgi:hypothetical protein